MSFAASKWAWGLNLADPSAKFVLLALADMANPDHLCWPKIKLLVQKTGLSRRTITRAMARLEADCLISREHRFRPDRGWLSNTYFLEISEGQQFRKASMVGHHGTGGGVTVAHPYEPINL